MNKRGISPVIATVLLVGIVIMMGVIIFIWFRNLQQEAITKFGETNIELICEEVKFGSSYQDGILYLSNSGNVPIYNFNVKSSSGGNYKTESVSELSGNWPENGLNQGSAFSEEIDFELGVETIEVIPVLVGNSKSGEKTFVCPDMYGQKINI